MGMELDKRCAFDAYCKRLVKNEAIDIHREYARQRRHEVSLSQLTPRQWQSLQYIDCYAPERRSFAVLGITIEIEDGELGRALDELPPDRRAIILLSYFLGMTDEEIAAQLHLRRSTVQYRRTSALETLRTLMEGYKHE